MADYPGFGFEITHRTTGDADWPGRARAGRLVTPHGSIETPAFVFCATKAAVKAVTPDQVEAANTQIILANTYHLMLQPGAERVARLGGLHRMMGWDGPMLTDSGGFQIFSLGHGSVAEEIKGHRSGARPTTLMEIDEAGATFRSYLDGDGAPANARGLDPHPAPARRRYHPGARRVHTVSRRPCLYGALDGAKPPLGRA